MTKHRLAVTVAAVLVTSIVLPVAFARTPKGTPSVIPELDRLSDRARVSVEFANVPAAKVLDAIATAGSLHLTFEGTEDCSMVTVSLKNATVREALEAVAAQTDLRFRVVDGETLRVKLPDPVALDETIAAPEIVTKVEPAYPKDAIQARVDGTVVLRVVVRDNGTVGEVQVLSAVTGHPSFDYNAVAAVREWKYRPAMKDGYPVSVYYTVTMDVSLRDADGNELAQQE